MPFGEPIDCGAKLGLASFKAKFKSHEAAIDHSLRSDELLDDAVVIAVMTDVIQEAEESGKDYIVSGFPRTRVQALALQKMKIIPTKFIVLNCDK